MGSQEGVPCLLISTIAVGIETPRPLPLPDELKAIQREKKGSLAPLSVPSPLSTLLIVCSKSSHPHLRSIKGVDSTTHHSSSRNRTQPANRSNSSADSNLEASDRREGRKRLGGCMKGCDLKLHISGTSLPVNGQCTLWWLQGGSRIERALGNIAHTKKKTHRTT